MAGMAAAVLVPCPSIQVRARASDTGKSWAAGSSIITIVLCCVAHCGLTLFHVLRTFPGGLHWLGG